MRANVVAGTSFIARSTCRSARDGSLAKIRMKRCRMFFSFSVMTLTASLPVPSSFGHGMGGGFAGGGHQGFCAPHHEMGFHQMGARQMGPHQGNRFHNGDRGFFDHSRFVHDRFFHHHNRFFFGFDFVAFGFPDWWYPYDWYPYDYYDYSDYSPVYDYRYWYGLATAVQSELTARGYYHGQINGMIGSDSRQAIRAFQQAHGLPVTGSIDPGLLKALNLPKVPRVA